MEFRKEYFPGTHEPTTEVFFLTSNFDLAQFCQPLSCKAVYVSSQLKAWLRTNWCLPSREVRNTFKVYQSPSNYPYLHSTCLVRVLPRQTICMYFFSLEIRSDVFGPFSSTAAVKCYWQLSTGKQINVKRSNKTCFPVAYFPEVKIPFINKIEIQSIYFDIK